MNIDQFRAQYPEFAQTPVPMIEAKLNAAAAEFDPAIWGNLLDEAHGLLTAHKLSTSPFGQAARLNAKDGRTTYLVEYERLRAAACCGGLIHVTKMAGDV